SAAINTAIAADRDRAFLQTDRAVFESGSSSPLLEEQLLDPNFTWTDSSGTTRSKSEIMGDVRAGKGLPIEAGKDSDGEKPVLSDTMAHAYGQVGVIQTTSGNLYILRIWVKRVAGWQLLIYQAVSIGAPPSAAPATGACDNPCNTVPFQPQTDDEREVIKAYQA